MIATILPGSTNFHAVGYNDRKVAKGVASLIEILNFGPVGQFGIPTTEEKIAFLQEYTSQNERIRKAQFHVAISCKGHEMTEEELLDFAHSYLKEMGYMESGQPLLVYAHRDTANTHLHIVTSRIGPDGKKIAHDNERRRSQEIIDRLMKINRADKVEEDVKKVLSYSFSTVGQFKAVLNTLGYEAYQKNDTLYIKFGGRIRKQMDVQELMAHATPYEHDYVTKNNQKMLRQILLKYRDLSSNKEEFKETLKSKFGIDIVFFGKKDTPFGYMLIDHKVRSVTKGNRLLSVERLLDFATPEERMDRVEKYIDDLLLFNPLLTQHELHNLLYKNRAYIKRGTLYAYGDSRPLKPEVNSQLKRNNSINWVEGFKPSNEVERSLLCDFAKLDEDAEKLVKLDSAGKEVPQEFLDLLRAIEEDVSITAVKGTLRKAGYFVRTVGNETYAINMKQSRIINLSALGFDIEAIRRRHKEQQLEDIRKRREEFEKRNHNNRGKGSDKKLPKGRDAGGGSHFDNREWEVGNNPDYDSVEESKRLKM